MSETRFKTFKDLPSEHLLGTGTAMCAGCGGLEALQGIYDILGEKTVFINAAGCMTLLSVYPFGRNPRNFTYNPLKKDYWKHFSFVTGFTVRRLTPWEEFYLGAAFPLANGVTFDVLAAFSQRDVPADLEIGQLVTTQNLEVVESDAERNVLLIKGSVPGPAGTGMAARRAVVIPRMPRRTPATKASRRPWPQTRS